MIEDILFLPQSLQGDFQGILVIIGLFFKLKEFSKLQRIYSHTNPSTN